MASNLRLKIDHRMDELEAALKQGLHLTNPNEVETMISNVAKFWSALSEEDRDFINAARFALEENLPWK